MEKKRRKKKVCESSRKIKINNEDCLELLIGILSNKTANSDVSIEEYSLSPTYGQGAICTYHFDGIWLSISNFKLYNDLLLTYGRRYNTLQLSFLLDGEKIISLHGAEKDIIYENQECYMAKIKELEGRIRISGGKPYKEVKIRLSPEFLKKMGIDNEVTFNTLSDTQLVRPITNKLFSILRELENSTLSGLNQRLFLNGKVLELLVFQMENYSNTAAAKALKGKNEVIKHLYAIRQYIIDNIDKNFSIKDLSRREGLNDYVLKKEFKRIFGYSINEFSKNEKMRYAQNLLKTTQIPIYEIAEEVGYKNATHFSVAFKKHLGITPKKFRMQL